jgi:hypothetical protein
MHSFKNLFCTVSTICNLAEEFNGLVSTRVGVYQPFFYGKNLPYSCCFYRVT